MMGEDVLLTSLDYGDAESPSVSLHRVPPAEDPCSNPLFFFSPLLSSGEEHYISYPLGSFCSSIELYRGCTRVIFKSK